MIETEKEKKMKVYELTWYSYPEDEFTLGIFSTKEKAEKARDYDMAVNHEQRVFYSDYHIYEYTLDELK
jgi:hypothetical protein